MKAEEIRQAHRMMVEDINKRTDSLENQQSTAIVNTMQMTCEIAAKLAEMNEQGSLNSIAIELEKINRPRKWVTLPWFNNPIVIDPRSVAVIFPAGDRTGIYIRGYQDILYTSLLFPEACAKLGIPVEG